MIGYAPDQQALRQSGTSMFIRDTTMHILRRRRASLSRSTTLMTLSHRLGRPRAASRCSDTTVFIGAAAHQRSSAAHRCCGVGCSGNQHRRRARICRNPGENPITLDHLILSVLHFSARSCPFCSFFPFSSLPVLAGFGQECQKVSFMPESSESVFSALFLPFLLFSAGFSGVPGRSASETGESKSFKAALAAVLQGVFRAGMTESDI